MHIETCPTNKSYLQANISETSRKQTVHSAFSVESTELDIVNGSFRNLCPFGCLAGVTYLRYTVLASPKKDETAVHCCDPALSVLVMFVSRNVFHVVSALQSIVFVT